MLVDLLRVLVVVSTVHALSSDDVAYSPHPTLFFDSWDVPDLRLKALTTHRVIAKRIVDAMETARRSPVDYLPPLSHEEFSSKSVSDSYGARD